MPLLSIFHQAALVSEFIQHDLSNIKSHILDLFDAYSRQLFLSHDDLGLR